MSLPSFALCSCFLCAFCYVISPPSSPHFHSFIIHILPPRSPPLFPCLLLPFVFSPPSHLLLSILLTLPSALRSHFSTAALEVIHFTNPKKANYLRFYDFHYFTTHTGFYYWVVDYQPLVHTCTHTHTHTYPHPHMQQRIHPHRRGETWEACIWRFRCLCLHGVRFVCQVTNNDSRSNKSRGIQCASSWAAVRSGGLYPCQSAICRDGIVSGIIIVKDTSALRYGSQSPLPTFPSLNFYWQQRTCLWEQSNIYECLWLCVCVCTAAICASCVLACLHMWSTTVYHS